MGFLGILRIILEMIFENSAPSIHGICEFRQFFAGYIYTLESFVRNSLSQVLLGETQQIMGDQKTQ